MQTQFSRKVTRRNFWTWRAKLYWNCHHKCPIQLGLHNGSHNVSIQSRAFNHDLLLQPIRVWIGRLVKGNSLRAIYNWTTTKVHTMHGCITLVFQGQMVTYSFLQEGKQLADKSNPLNLGGIRVSQTWGVPVSPRGHKFPTITFQIKKITKFKTINQLTA